VLVGGTLYQLLIILSACCVWCMLGWLSTQGGTRFCSRKQWRPCSWRMQTHHTEDAPFWHIPFNQR
jgi:hypothetical protein